MKKKNRGVMDDGEADVSVAAGLSHVPVMLAEVLAALQPIDDALIVDGTFGAGGYSSAILEAARCQVLAFDRDLSAIAAASEVTRRYGGRLRVLGVPFGKMDEFVRIEQASAGVQTLSGGLVDGVVLDIGVSSMQIDQPERGFSFQSDGPLDMRMSQTGRFAGPSAADIVNTLDADPLADILFQLGEERRSRHIAKAIVMDRAKTPFTRTKQLADLVCRVLKTPKIDGRHAATRTFQALRIHVNDELGELRRGLEGAERLLKPGGRLVVVSFHSLEDRIVKDFLRVRAGRLPQGSRHGPVVVDQGPKPSFSLDVAKGETASEAEIAANPRSRSARLRWAVRTEAPAWSVPNSGPDWGPE
jgi:16S rRNA (cytosine1402-N4)-methyltransferase